MKTTPDELPEDQVSERLDRALKRALKTPPVPHKSNKTKSAKKPSGRQRASDAT